MWLHFLAGDHTAAADAHEQLAARLGFSGGVESPQTQALWRVVKRGAAAAPAVSAVAAAADLQPGLRHPPVLVGRQGQWTAMTDAWSGGRVFLLQGEGGIGKTRLLNDFLRHEGAAVVVSAISGDGDAPYATLATLLRALINQQALDLDRTPRLALASVLPELARSGDAAPADHLAICRAAEAVLEQAAESGVRAVALDNLHHADLASLEAWRRLASGPARHLLHFACAARALVAGVQHDAVTDWFGDSQPLVLIELLPWTHAEVAALLPTLDLVKGPASITAEQLHAWVGGNPFYVLETLRELARRPADRVDPTLPKPTGALPLAAYLSGKLPPGRAGLILTGGNANLETVATLLVH